jgi:hypothetical protein
MIAFLARFLSINLKRTVPGRHSVRLTGSVANRWRFLSKLAASAFMSILVERQRCYRRMSASILQFWAWHCQIHGLDCLPRSNVCSHAIFCRVTRTISFDRLTLDFNSGRLRISRGYVTIANKQIAAT